MMRYGSFGLTWKKKEGENGQEMSVVVSTEREKERECVHVSGKATCRSLSESGEKMCVAAVENARDPENLRLVQQMQIYI